MIRVCTTVSTSFGYLLSVLVHSFLRGVPTEYVDRLARNLRVFMFGKGGRKLWVKVGYRRVCSFVVVLGVVYTFGLGGKRREVPTTGVGVFVRDTGFWVTMVVSVGTIIRNFLRGFIGDFIFGL